MQIPDLKSNSSYNIELILVGLDGFVSKKAGNIMCNVSLLNILILKVHLPNNNN